MFDERTVALKPPNSKLKLPLTILRGGRALRSFTRSTTQGVKFHELPDTRKSQAKKDKKGKKVSHTKKDKTGNKVPEKGGDVEAEKGGAAAEKGVAVEAQDNNSVIKHSLKRALTRPSFKRRCKQPIDYSSNKNRMSIKRRHAFSTRIVVPYEYMSMHDPDENIVALTIIQFPGNPRSRIDNPMQAGFEIGHTYLASIVRGFVFLVVSLTNAFQPIYWFSARCFTESFELLPC
ncbi:hypothetical protein TSUD_326780 [Trifolium subterraneum]|uniref:Uncharacterized protein n=1 Tax=Trifolium subterraneum TaxID=3900 RepID=A0A2Z6MVF5_TRISU|nr:hypothetical protein TSUD_326780 [Trifolium subterraneum]